MGNEVIIALVSGVVAAFSAVVAYIQTVRTARFKSATDLMIEGMRGENERLNAATQRAIEEVKQESDNRRDAFDRACREVEPVEEAMGDAWQDVQEVKEIISKLLGTGRYDADLVLSDLQAVCDRVSLGYKRWGSRLPERARNAWHSAKNEVDVVSALVRKQSQAEKVNPVLTQHDVEQLKDLRVSLTDRQGQLAYGREFLRNYRADKILEFLRGEYAHNSDC